MAKENDVFGERLANRKKSKVATVAKWFGCTILGLGVVGAAYLKFTPNGQNLGRGLRAIVQVHQDPNYIFEHDGSDQVNILLIGRDVNYKPGKVYDPHTKTYRPYHVVDKNTPARSDSMILMTLDKVHRLVRMVSIPRDAMVHMPNNKYHVRLAKLNAAHAYGGPHMLVQAIHEDLGLTVHHWAVIKFDGFKKLIDEVGGVDVNVEGALKRNPTTGKLYRGDLIYNDNWGNLHQHMVPGMQHLNGQEAHDYVRFREDLEGDGGRMRRQQGVMRALAKKIMHLSPFKIPGMVTEVRHQFDTDMTDKDIASAAFFCKDLGSSQKIQPLTMFGAFKSRGAFTLNKSKNIALLSYVFGKTFDPDSFLQNSPSTEDDELGPTNNSSPEAKAVLRAAGLTKDADEKPAHEVTVPVVVEPLDAVEESGRHHHRHRD